MSDCLLIRIQMLSELSAGERTPLICYVALRYYPVMRANVLELLFGLHCLWSIQLDLEDDMHESCCMIDEYTSSLILVISPLFTVRVQ